MNRLFYICKSALKNIKKFKLISFIRIASIYICMLILCIILSLYFGEIGYINGSNTFRNLHRLNLYVANSPDKDITNLPDDADFEFYASQKRIIYNEVYLGGISLSVISKNYDNLYDDFFYRGTGISNRNDCIIGLNVARKYKICNNCYDYILSNEFFEYLYKSSFDSNIAKLFSLVSILLIIIVYIGMLSFFIMLIEKRKFEISVCLALGAKKKQIFSELSIEFLIISLTPTLLGLAVANTIINNGFKFINIYISNYSVIAEILILLSIIIINFSCLNFVLCKIRKLKPQEILYKNI